MVAVGLGGLVYAVRREMQEDNDDAVFLWNKLAAPGSAAASDLHGSSAIDVNTFAMVGGPSSYVAVTAGSTLELSSASLGDEAPAETLSSVYMSTPYTLVTASASGGIFRSGDGGHSFVQVDTPPEVAAVAWTAMHGRNAADESAASDNWGLSSWGLRLGMALIATAPSWCSVSFGA
mmetsp:Transcript_47256/g.94724  ORF Transcript_47256/g.94724 Transcript_47256/m.94724 type:complete len:177 (-) Transcript_47256:67-597(-)